MGIYKPPDLERLTQHAGLHDLRAASRLHGDKVYSARNGSAGQVHCLPDEHARGVSLALEDPLAMQRENPNLSARRKAMTSSP